MTNIYRKIFLSFFKDKDFSGRIVIVSDGHSYDFGRESAERKKVDIVVLDKKFFKKIILYGDIGLGEAYFLKYFTSQDLKALLEWFVQNKERLPGFNRQNKKYPLFEWAKYFSALLHRLNKNTISGSKKNISKHYDVSNDFYKLWLDPSMTYSAAIFRATNNLEQAQKEKYRQICEKIKLNSRDSLLEIGSGWGAFAIFAVKNYGCKVSTITISKKQYSLAKEKIKQEGLEDKIDIKLEDYRCLEGSYDKIVSIEMMEALGHEYVPLFLSKCNKLLKKGGMICYQCITIPDEIFREYLRNNNYIKKYIFPGGELISLGALRKNIEKSKELDIVSLESIGLDYAKTLRAWRDNFVEKKKEILKLGFDEVFYRKWVYYFVYCEVGFGTKYLDDVQILIEKKYAEKDISK